MTAVTLHHEAAGPPGAPPLVLIGSLGTRLSMWDPQIEALSARSRVIRCDVRGHGGSPVPPGPYAISDLGADLLATLDALNIERAQLCGVSIGGMISLWAAANAPERVARVAVCCTTARFDAAAADAYRQRAETVRASGFEGLANAVLARWFTPGFAQSRPEVVARMRADLIATPPEGYAACCEALAELDLTSALARITAPLLVIAGAEDQATPPEHGEAIAAAVGGARFESVARAAHLASIEQSQRVNRLLANFFEEA